MLEKLSMRGFLLRSASNVAISKNKTSLLNHDNVVHPNASFENILSQKPFRGPRVYKINVCDLIYFHKSITCMCR